MAVLQAALDAAVRVRSGEAGGRRIAVIGMGRLGGRELGLRLGRGRAVRVRARRGVSRLRRGEFATRSVAETVRRLLGAPSQDPPLQVDADLRPEGTAGAAGAHAGLVPGLLPRSGPRCGRRRRCCGPGPIAGDDELGARFVAMIDPVRYPARRAGRRVGAGDPPDQGAGRRRTAAARRRPEHAHQARPRRARRRRVDRAAAAAAARRTTCPALRTPSTMRRDGRRGRGAACCRRGRRGRADGGVDARDQGAQRGRCWCAASRPTSCRRPGVNCRRSRR